MEDDHTTNQQSEVRSVGMGTQARSKPIGSGWQTHIVLGEPPARSWRCRYELRRNPTIHSSGVSKDRDCDYAEVWTTNNGGGEGTNPACGGSGRPKWIGMGECGYGTSSLGRYRSNSEEWGTATVKRQGNRPPRQC